MVYSQGVQPAMVEGLGFATPPDTSKGQSQFYMAATIHCPSVRAEMSEGRDKVLCALTTVPNPLVLQGWSECTELLPLFILACLSDDISSTAASSQVKKKRTYHPATIP